MNGKDMIEAGGFSVEFVGPPVAKVDLILEPADAVAGLATIVRGYKQVYSDVPPGREEEVKLLLDINRTKLHTPLEMLSYTWLIRDVSRAFTHQLVRTRVGAAYVQESMRFSDKRHAKVLVPPAISGDAGRLGAYRETVAEAFQTYAQMVTEGVPIQDARGVLPHNVLTHVFVSYTLSTLAKTASLRYCCQAQNMKADGEGEWRTVLEQMKATLPRPLQTFVCSPWEAGEVSCGFEASFDRPCAWPEKFTANFEALKQKRLKAEIEASHRPLPGQLELPLDTVAQPGEPAHPSVQPPAFGDLRTADATAERVRMGLDLNQPMGHGGPAIPFPESAPEFIKIYEKDDFRAFVWGNVLHVEMTVAHLWRGVGGLSIRLYQDKILVPGEKAGAEVIHVHVKDSGNVYMMSLPDFEASGHPSQNGPGTRLAYHIPLTLWRSRTAKAYMEEMRDVR